MNKSTVMKKAWEIFKKNGGFQAGVIFAECLKKAWADCFSESLFDGMFDLPTCKPKKIVDFDKVQAPKTYFNGDPYWHVQARILGGVR